MAQFGEILAELRQDRGLTQRDLAKLFFVTPGTISNLPVDVFSTPLLDDMTSGEMIQLVQTLSPDRKKALCLLLRDLHFSTVVGQYNYKEAK